MHDAGIPYLREVLLFLALAGVFVPLLQRLRVSNVLGFLVVGVVVGPWGLGRLADGQPWLAWLSLGTGRGVAPLAQIGVMFLMFAIGLELSTERLWAMRRWVFGAGTLQVLLTIVLVGWIASVAGLSSEAALVTGIVLAFSSTAVIMQLLAARRELGSPAGRATFSILLFQDLAVVPALIVVGTLGGPRGDQVVLAVALALLKAVAAIAFIYLLGRQVIRPLFRWLAASRQADTFMALTLLASLGIATLTWLAGLSMALGAFLAGLLLAETEYRHEVDIAIDPFRGLLMGLFFMSVGMDIDPAALLRDPLRLPAVVLGMVLLKAFVAASVVRAFGLSNGRAIEAGLLLGAGGEFAFVVIGAATAQRVLGAAEGAFMMLVVGLSLFVAPVLASLGRRLGDRFDRPGRKPADESATPAARGLRGHVVIAGFGRVGQLLARLLDAEGIPWVAVDDHPATVARFHAQGLPVFVGDAGRVEMLQRLASGSASAVALTMDRPAAALRALGALHGQWPAVPVLARARDERHAAELLAAGAHDVVPDALEAALQLGGRLLEAVGLPEELAGRIVLQERSRSLSGVAGNANGGTA